MKTDNNEMYSIRKILFYTNCSKNAQKAFNYTLSVARYFDAEVVVLYVSELKVDTMAPSILRYQLQQEEKRKAERVLEKFLAENTYQNKPVIHPVVEMGFAKENISIYAKKNDEIDFIVLATSDEPRLKKVLWGTTISTVIDEVNVPVLVLPKGIIFRDILNIAFISPEGEDWQELYPDMKQLAQYFGAKLYITHLNDPKVAIKEEEEHAVLSDYKRALQAFVYNQDIHLLVTSAMARSTIQRMLKYSMAQRMALKVTIPLLVWKNK